MGFWSWLLGKRRELEKMEADVRRNPTPGTISALCDMYLQKGEGNNAVETARRAIQRFPDSPKIREMHAKILRLHNQNALNKLQKELENRPQATTYSRLAEIHFAELNDANRALELATDGLEKFPQSEELHMIASKIRQVRYMTDKLAKDGLKCVEHLEAAAQLNPMNYKGNALLAHLLTQAGAYERAQAPLQAILRFAPDDGPARTLLEKLRGVTQASSDLEDLFKALESAGGPSEEAQALADLIPVDTPTVTAVTGRIDAQAAATNIEGFRRMDGAKAAMVMDEQGQVVASFASSGSVAELAQTVFMIYSTSEDSGRRMDIGSFKRGILESPGMRLHLVEAGGHIVAVATGKATRDEVVRASINSFIDSVLRG
jgi:cytochrome c-type biogenesis protein CcmH/NrfG